MEVYLRGVELAIRGGTAEEPTGRHALVGRSADLPALRRHLEQRSDCVSLVVIGDSDPERLRDLGHRRPGFRLLATDGRDPDALRRWLLPIPALVLAAGAGSRMGGDKMLRDLGARPLVHWALEAASEGGADYVTAVYAEEAVERALPASVGAVHNPAAAEGQATSLAAGLAALEGDGNAAGAIVLLGDQPLVGAATVHTLLLAWRMPRRPPAVAASYQGSSWLPPVVLGRELWPLARALRGDQGARALFRERPEMIAAIPVPGRPDDADTPDDLDRITQLLE